MNCSQLKHKREVFNNPLFMLMNNFLRIRSILRENFYCLPFPTATVDINVETLKENGILLLQFAQNVVEVSF